MEEELNLDLSSPDEQQQSANRVEQRLRNLNSEKAKLAADKEELSKAKELAETEKATALKDVDFYKNFNTLSAKYEGASEYQDKIREKVMAGYDIEDATVAVLNREGKLATPNVQSPPPPKENPAGGSANNVVTGGEKSLSDMTKDEKFAKLQEAGMEGELRKVLKI